MSYRPRSSVHLSRLMRDKLGLRASSLADQLRQARRVLPRALKEDATLLLEAEDCAGNPRLARQLDPRTVGAARKRLQRWLQGPGPRQRLERRIMGAMASFLVSLTLGLVLLGGLASLS